MDSILLAIGFGLVTASVISVAALGFTFQFAVAGIFNLAYGDVMTVSAFSAYLAAARGVGLGASLAIGAATGAVALLVLQRGVFAPFARKGTGLFGIVVVTIAVALIVQNLMQVATKADYYNYPFDAQRHYRALGMVFTDVQLNIIALNVAIVLGLQLLLKKTKLGKAIRATSANPELARNCGIRTGRVADVTSVIAGILCGFGGVILAINIVTFNFTTGAEFLVLLISAAVLGGIGHPVGAVVGAVIIGIASEMTATLVDPSYNLTVAFLFLGLVLLFRPQGIFSDIAERKNVIA